MGGVLGLERRAEQREKAVAEELVHDAAMTVEDIHQQAITITGMEKVQSAKPYSFRAATFPKDAVEAGLAQASSRPFASSCMESIPIRVWKTQPSCRVVGSLDVELQDLGRLLEKKSEGVAAFECL